METLFNYGLVWEGEPCLLHLGEPVLRISDGTSYYFACWKYDDPYLENPSRVGKSDDYYLVGLFSYVHWRLDFGLHCLGYSKPESKNYRCYWELGQGNWCNCKDCRCVSHTPHSTRGDRDAWNP